MKKIFMLAVMAVLAMTASLPTYAQFKIGPRVGMTVNKLSFDDKLFKGENQTGFTGGLEAEFTVPVLGIGADASVMYVRRNAKFMAANHYSDANRDYVSIPINLKWKINIPVIASVVKPYIYTGPEFAFLTSKHILVDKKHDTSWNVGVGVEFIKHLQVSAQYGIGLSKTVEIDVLNSDGLPGTSKGIEGKDKYWTVTAAWLF